MANKRQYTAEQVIEALKASAGIQAAAARRLGCDRNTIGNYIKRYATVRQALEEARDTTIDLAESKLIEKVQAGEWPAIAFTLKTVGRTVGRHRGYVERQEYERVTGDELRQMPDDELDDLIEG
jgi:GH24 family phage-related lysozyme (muramidase)